MNLKNVYPNAKNLKLYECDKEEERVPESVDQQIYFQRVKIARRERALLKHKEYHDKE